MHFIALQNMRQCNDNFLVRKKNDFHTAELDAVSTFFSQLTTFSGPLNLRMLHLLFCNTK